jgi:hypothetical protein
VAGEGVLRAEGDLEASGASLTGQSRASNRLSGKKMPEGSPGARRGGRDVKIGSEIGLERFQAQLSSTQMGRKRPIDC